MGSGMMRLAVAFMGAAGKRQRPELMTAGDGCAAAGDAAEDEQLAAAVDFVHVQGVFKRRQAEGAAWQSLLQMVLTGSCVCVTSCSAL
jgi:hypothetical protein